MTFFAMSHYFHDNLYIISCMQKMSVFLLYSTLQ